MTGIYTSLSLSPCLDALIHSLLRESLMFISLIRVFRFSSDYMSRQYYSSARFHFLLHQHSSILTLCKDQVELIDLLLEN